MRTSNNKIIRDEELFNRLFPQYQCIIDALSDKYQSFESSEYENLVNFQSNLSSPKHGWYDYKQGYSEQLVKNIVSKAHPEKAYYILDPFCGVGTTNLTAQSLGYKSLGTDINPMAILATEVKTHFFCNSEIEIIERAISTFSLPKHKEEITSKVVNTSFTDDVIDVLLRIKFFVESTENVYAQKFFRLALISIIDTCSLKVKDGNGLKFKKNYKPVPDVVALYLEKCHKMLDDIKRANFNIECSAELGSLLNNDIFLKFKDKKVGLCVFSPPYANCFDYCEVYKLELWIGGFVKSYKDFTQFRSMALRSHVNSKFSHDFNSLIPEVDLIASLISAFNIWNKNIPDMLRGYFDDMKLLLENVYKLLVPEARCFIVVANSAYKGILVPTDLILCDIAEKIGYKYEGINVARRIRASSQQMKGLYETYDNLVRESIIELKK